jgi:myo-inositol-1(or 4)-monophosphatase
MLDTLWPFLQVADTYARDLQVRIRAHPAKTGADHPFAAALTDADLSMQTLLEVAVLAPSPPCASTGKKRRAPIVRGIFARET